jgi:hypothetical protein
LTELRASSESIATRSAVVRENAPAGGIRRRGVGLAAGTAGHPSTTPVSVLDPAFRIAPELQIPGSKRCSGVARRRLRRSEARSAAMRIEALCFASFAVMEFATCETPLGREKLR